MRTVLYWWNVLNDAVFYGELPKPISITLVQHKKTFAWIIPQNYQQVALTIQPTFVSRELFLTVLVHEMVHVWELLHFKRLGHGKRFFSWKDRIKQTTTLTLDVMLDENEYNYNIT